MEAVGEAVKVALGGWVSVGNGVRVGVAEGMSVRLGVTEAVGVKVGGLMAVTARRPMACMTPAANANTTPKTNSCQPRDSPSRRNRK